MVEISLKVYTDNLEIARDLMNTDHRPKAGDTMVIDDGIELICEEAVIGTGLVYLEELEFSLRVDPSVGNLKKAATWIHRRLTDRPVTLRIEGQRAEVSAVDDIQRQFAAV